MKKGLKIAAITVGVIIILMFLLPFAFQGKIADIVKTEGNKMLNAQFDFKNLNISLFRNFPQASVTLEDFWLKGTGEFANDTLVQAGEVTAAVNLFSLFGDSGYDISKIFIEDTKLHAIILPDGRANWDIMKPDTIATAETPVAEEEEASSPFKVKLQRFVIKNMNLIYVSGCRGRRLSRFGFRIRGRSAEEGRAWSRTKPAGCEKRRRMVRIPKNYTIFILSLFTLPLKKGGVMEKQFSFNYEHYAALAELSDADRELVREAERATANANAPYSKFRVGAAARLRSGKILYGSNFESEVYPAGLCAERTLMFYAQANYADDPIETLAIASDPSERECYPCGQCRQVMVDVERRQGAPMRVIMSGGGTATAVDSAALLLPFTFVL